MRTFGRWITALLVVAAGSLAACGGTRSPGHTLNPDAGEQPDAVPDGLPEGDAGPQPDAPAETDGPGSPWITFAVISDTHVIDDFYVPGGESNDLDNRTVLVTRENLAAARAVLNRLEERPELVILPGDMVHNYPLEQEDWGYYTATRTRFDLAAELMTGFSMPVYWAPGNHDYDVPAISREFSHRLFQEKFGTPPYYAVERRGVLFLALNSQLGDTWDPASPRYNTDLGSFGTQQLDWLEAQLARGLPTILFWHIPLPSCARQEDGTRDIAGILKAWPNIVHVFNGHLHLWMKMGELAGLPLTLVASTRYDPDNYLLVRVNRDTGEVIFTNDADVDWWTQHAKPYQWPLPEGWEGFTPGACALAAPPDPHGFDRLYVAPSSGDALEDKDFALFGLLSRLVAARAALEGDPALALQAQEARDGLENGADCQGDCGCLLARAGLDVEELSTARAGLVADLGAPLPGLDLAGEHLRPSGLFFRFADHPDAELLGLAFDEQWSGLAGAFQRFCGEAGPAAMEQLRAQTVIDGEALFFEPLLALTLATMRQVGRDEAARYEPLCLGENRAACERAATLDYSGYPFSAIVVPGQGPADLNTPLLPAGAARCDVAVERWKAGLAPFLLPSGGHVHPDKTPYSEALEMKKYLMQAHGVPEDAILIDPHARHTTTNLRNASRVVLRLGLPADKPLLVTSDAFQSVYILGLAERCQEELHYLPWRALQRLTATDSCLLPSLSSLHAAPGDPLDP